ncbi:hypothetical protein [Serinibacter salmoneus]|uniref:Uncharacterized protein n=1 Tax=Serinibacter salmoneus TaxID=556530 RepID=A0A2A9CWN7_9MICO|nr:hypothetical protein [Serinibacter salmoneus]PFG18556.1 hypothetical protein ATL40_0096 [Serinibacter salmoneus]
MRWRRRSPHPAHLTAGFVAQEAAAHAPALEALLGRPRVGASVPIEVGIDVVPGARMVILLRNRNVAFVPVDHEAELRAQLPRRGVLTHPGEAFVHDGAWQVWVGPSPRPVDAQVPPGTIDPEPPSVGGIPLRRPGR